MKKDDVIAFLGTDEGKEFSKNFEQKLLKNRPHSGFGDITIKNYREMLTEELAAKQ